MRSAPIGKLVANPERGLKGHVSIIHYYVITVCEYNAAA